MELTRYRMQFAYYNFYFYLEAGPGKINFSFLAADDANFWEDLLGYRLTVSGYFVLIVCCPGKGPKIFFKLKILMHQCLTMSCVDGLSDANVHHLFILTLFHQSLRE